MKRFFCLKITILRTNKRYSKGNKKKILENTWQVLIFFR